MCPDLRCKEREAERDHDINLWLLTLLKSNMRPDIDLPVVKAGVNEGVNESNFRKVWERLLVVFALELPLPMFSNPVSGNSDTYCNHLPQSYFHELRHPNRVVDEDRVVLFAGVRLDFRCRVHCVRVGPQPCPLIGDQIESFLNLSGWLDPDVWIEQRDTEIRVHGQEPERNGDLWPGVPEPGHRRHQDMCRLAVRCHNLS